MNYSHPLNFQFRMQHRRQWIRAVTGVYDGVSLCNVYYGYSLAKQSKAKWSEEVDVIFHFEYIILYM